MVVKPPQKPVASNKRISVDSVWVVAAKPAINPISRQPAMFEINVPNGILKTA